MKKNYKIRSGLDISLSTNITDYEKFLKNLNWYLDKTRGSSNLTMGDLRNVLISLSHIYKNDTAITNNVSDTDSNANGVNYYYYFYG